MRQNRGLYSLIRSKKYSFYNIEENNDFYNITQILYKDLWFNKESKEDKKLNTTYVLKA